MFNKTGGKFVFVAIFLLISSCDAFKNDSLTNICKNSPELCEDIYIVADCRFKRTSLIRARYYDKIEPTEIHKKALLTELDEYQSCLELTLFLQFTRNKQRKEQRLHNYLRAQELMKENIKASKGTQDPILAYYLWTHHQDKQARQVFLAAATQEGVSDAQLLFKLATDKSIETPQDALNIFYNALTLSDSMQHIPHSSFMNIMNIFYKSKHYEEAYIWALIAIKADKQKLSSINLELILQKGIMGGEKLISNDNQLQLKATNYYEQLQAGTFNEVPPLIIVEPKVN